MKYLMCISIIFLLLHSGCVFISDSHHPIDSFFKQAFKSENIYATYSLSSEELGVPYCTSRAIFVFSEMKDNYSVKPDLFFTSYIYPDEQHGGIPYVGYRERLSVSKSFHYIGIEDLTLNGVKEIIVIRTGGAGSTRTLSIYALSDLKLRTILYDMSPWDFELANIDEDDYKEVLVREMEKTKMDPPKYYRIWDYDIEGKKYNLIKEKVLISDLDDIKKTVLSSQESPSGPPMSK